MRKNRAAHLFAPTLLTEPGDADDIGVRITDGSALFPGYTPSAGLGLVS